jgi:hypothetical protein
VCKDFSGEKRGGYPVKSMFIGPQNLSALIVAGNLPAGLDRRTSRIHSYKPLNLLTILFVEHTVLKNN